MHEKVRIYTQKLIFILLCHGYLYIFVFPLLYYLSRKQDNFELAIVNPWYFFNKMTSLNINEN